MAVHKFTFLINWGTRAGWTETWFKDVTTTGTNNNAIKTTAQNYADRRARCLSAKAMIVAARVSPVTNTRDTTLVSLNKPGVLGIGILFNNPQGADVPHVAQLITFTSSAGSKRNFLQRGLADDDVKEGVISFAANGKGPYSAFWDYLIANGWAMRDYTNAQDFKVKIIDNLNKIMVTEAATGYVDKTLVVVQSRISGNGLKTRWQGRTGPPDGLNIPLRGWHMGDMAGGVVHAITPTYPLFNEWAIPEPNWARGRQTGRPFGLPRGRQPKRT